MAQIRLRSPQFKSISTTSGNVQSTELVLEIDGTVRYRIIKNKAINTTLTVFEISELCRDYLNIEYASNFLPITIDIKTTLINYNDLNGGGTQVGSSVITDDKGWEAYGSYLDGANPENAISNWLISPSNIGGTVSNTYQIFVPIGVAGSVAVLNSNGNGIFVNYSDTQSFILTAGVQDALKINRIDCSKYGDGRKIVFINKFGAQQDLWFSLKSTDKIARKNENYKSSTINYEINPADYQISNAPVRVFNTQAKKTYTLNSGYYPEGAVEWFEQLLLSEYVWLEIAGTIIPVRVKSSAITLKTSLNDGLINYTMEFEDAFDYINNIR